MLAARYEGHDFKRELSVYKDRNVCCLDERRGCACLALKRLKHQKMATRLLVMAYELVLTAGLWCIASVSRAELVAIALHIAMYALLCASHPGYVASDLEADKGPDYRFCSTCQAWCPPRSHHCSTCQRCVRRMDHHCVVTANCCGQDNLALYLLYEMTTTALCTYAAVRTLRFEMVHNFAILQLAMLVLAGLISTAMATGYLTCLHIVLIFRNMTMREWLSTSNDGAAICTPCNSSHDRGL